MSSEEKASVEALQLALLAADLLLQRFNEELGLPCAEPRKRPRAFSARRLRSTEARAGAERAR